MTVEILNLNGAFLYETTRNSLAGENLENINLENADLRRADLQGVNLRGARLTGADFTGSDLSGAVLFEANLIDVNLASVNLRGANLSGANLYGANLSGAILYGADLTGSFVQCPYPSTAGPADCARITPGWVRRSGGKIDETTKFSTLDVPENAEEDAPLAGLTCPTCGQPMPDEEALKTSISEKLHKAGVVLSTAECMAIKLNYSHSGFTKPK